MFVPPSAIDILFDYRTLVANDALCEIPLASQDSDVAIVGAGISGLAAGYELLKMGLKPTIYEATDRIGGRLYSQPFEGAGGKAPIYAEMGAMRIPESSHLFFHYAKKMGIGYSSLFPDPGIVDTLIHYRNSIYRWEKEKLLPHPFSQIKLLWELFTDSSVQKIHKEWSLGNIDSVKALWQMEINKYKNKSFYQALMEDSLINDKERAALFGALGIGSGGFSPVFHIGYLEILRMLINGYMQRQYLIQDGVSEFANRLCALEVESQFGEKLSLLSSQAVQLSTPIVGIDFNIKTNNPILIFEEKSSKKRVCKEYRAVLFTGSLHALPLLNFGNKTDSGVYLFGQEVRAAIKNLSMIASSKTFILTKTKFWIEKNIPPCILTDDLPRGIYFLDYPHTDCGVICLSYTWGDDALKISGVDPKERLKIFKQVVGSIVSGIEDDLVPLNDEILCIDWVNEKYQHGAFKLLVPGGDEKQKQLYFQFQSVLTPEDKGIYLAGDSISWSGGWVEGALYTAINGVYSIAKRLGARCQEGTPLQQDSLYEY